MKEGDANTMNFHNFTNGRRKKNRICRLRNANGEWCTDRNQIQGILV